jgi:hypothetical protein
MFGHRRYLHRFAWMNEALEVQAVSRPFYFLRPGFEYCIGLCPAHEAGKLILGLGQEDSAAVLLQVSEAAVRACLRPVQAAL